MTRALAVLVFASALAAAPVPAGPRELTREMMTAEWHHEYDVGSGPIVLAADGTYRSVYRSGEFELAESGTWEVEGATLYFDNRRTRWTFDLKKWPVLTGESCGGARVVMSRPKR